MKRLFLTSSMHDVAKDIVKRLGLTTGNKLVFIDTASEKIDDDKEWLRNDRSALVQVGFDVTDYTITGKTENILQGDLAKYDYIFLSGGDTPHLLEQSHKSGFFTLIKDLIHKEGKTYIGVSAGSIIAGPVVPEYLFEKADLPDRMKRRGYGLINFTIVPHWGSKFFQDEYLKRRLKMVYREKQNPLLLLTDHQYVYVQDGLVEIIDTTK